MKSISWILLMAVSLSGCRFFGFYTYNTRGEKQWNKDAGISIPANIKKRKRSIMPTANFIASIKEYRFRYKHFPQDLAGLRNSSAKSLAAFKEMQELGFTQLALDYVYLDSMVIKFEHLPVYNQQIGTQVYSGRPVTGKFIFTVKPDSSFLYIRKFD